MAYSFSVQPVILAGVLNTANIPSGTSIAGILDVSGGINRQYQPSMVGYTPTTGDATTKWFPTTNAALTAASVNDQYWTPVPGNTVPQPNTKIGQVILTMAPGTSDAVRASSVLNFRLSPNAQLILVTGTSA